MEDISLSISVRGNPGKILVEKGRHTVNADDTVQGPQMNKREKKMLIEATVCISHCFLTVVTCFTSPLPCLLSTMCLLYLISNHEPKLIFFPYVTYKRYFCPRVRKVTNTEN